MTLHPQTDFQRLNIRIKNGMQETAVRGNQATVGDKNEDTGEPDHRLVMED
jgi:hypothetical protein